MGRIKRHYRALVRGDRATPRIGSVSPLDVAYGGSFLPSQRLLLRQSQG